MVNLLRIGGHLAFDDRDGLAITVLHNSSKKLLDDEACFSRNYFAGLSLHIDDMGSFAFCKLHFLILEICKLSATCDKKFRCVNRTASNVTTALIHTWNDNILPS